VVQQGLLGLQRRLQTIDSDLLKREAAAAKAGLAQQDDRASEQREAVRRLKEERARHQEKYEHLKAVVEDHRGSMFQQNIHAELREVDDRIDTLDGALQYVTAQIAGLRAEDRTAVAPRPLAAIPDLRPPMPDPAATVIAVPRVSSPREGSPQLQGVVRKYHQMIVDLRAREGERLAQAEEDRETIRKLEATIVQLGSAHREELERAQGANRHLLQRVLQSTAMSDDLSTEDLRRMV